MLDAPWAVLLLIASLMNGGDPCQCTGYNGAEFGSQGITPLVSTVYIQEEDTGDAIHGNCVDVWFPITQGFGPASPKTRKWYPIHQGVDYGVPVGTDVHGMQEGTVHIGNDPGGYGLHVIITGPDGTQTLYGHLSKVNVTEGARVSKGTMIGLSGNTGLSTGPHLHFGVKKGTWTDPLAWLADQGEGRAACAKGARVRQTLVSCGGYGGDEGDRA